MTVGERIRTLREQLNITQTELALSVNATKQTIYKYENGIITNIPSDKIEAIASVLHCSPSYLMGWENNSPVPHTLAAHFDGDEYTEEELDEIRRYAEFVKSKRQS